MRSTEGDGLPGYCMVPVLDGKGRLVCAVQVDEGDAEQLENLQRILRCGKEQR